jgi:DNA mismatch repair protein MutL
MPIHKLPPDIINKIAAGEVVERPASVVKELVENALDAGATHIEVEIKNGGKDYIRIQDNGCGMSESDVKMAIEQHATSKIKNIEDLFSINSFGFRGEALASISSVSDFLLTTDCHDLNTDNNVGTLLKVIDGVKSIEPASSKKGTKIEVKNLFKNIPARREYLKGQGTEYNHILDVFTQFALINPKVHFELIHNDKQIYNLQPVGDIIKRAEILFNKDVTESLVSCSQKIENFDLNGYIGKTHMFYNNRNYQYLFINGRYIKSPIISKAILQGYGSQIPRGMHP